MSVTVEEGRDEDRARRVERRLAGGGGDRRTERRDRAVGGDAQADPGAVDVTPEDVAGQMGRGPGTD